MTLASIAVDLVCYYNQSIIVKTAVAQDEHVGHFNSKCNSKGGKLAVAVHVPQKTKKSLLVEPAMQLKFKAIFR